MTTSRRFAKYLSDQGLAKSTIYVYIGYLKAAIRTVGTGSLTGYLDGDIAATTRASAYTAIKHWAEFTSDEDLLAELNHPTLRKSLKGRGKRASKVTRPMTGDELDAFLKTLERTKGRSPEWVWPCVTILLRLGLRARVDLCRLRRAEITEGLRSGRLQLETKGGRMRAVPISPAKEAFSELLRTGKWETVAEAIVGIDDPKRAYEEIYKAVKGLAKAAGIDHKEVHPHRLRHTAAHRLWEKTKDILKVRDFLGHAHVATTERYLRGDRTDEIGADLEDMYND